MTRGAMLGRRRLMERRGLEGTLDNSAIRRDGLCMMAEDDIEIDPRLDGPRDETGESAWADLAYPRPKGGTTESSSVSVASSTGESLNVSK
jgi:hypothetical protein